VTEKKQTPPVQTRLLAAMETSSFCASSGTLRKTSKNASGRPGLSGVDASPEKFVRSWVVGFMKVSSPNMSLRNNMYLFDDV